MRAAGRHYLIIGGGCYGSYYVRQLLAARARGLVDFAGLRVLDRDPACQVAQEHAGAADVEVVVSGWEEAGALVFQHRRRWGGDHLVPAPIAPHIAWEWLRRQLVADGVAAERVRALPWSGEAPQLPFAQVVRDGTLVLSHAPGMCPINCVEPRRCPLTSSWRDWELRDTLLIEHAQGRVAADRLLTLVCRHAVYGVGTIPLRDLLDAYDRLRSWADGEVRVAIATVSACHGIVDGLEIAAACVDRG